MNLEKEDLQSIPVWIKLPNLKLHYYIPTGLSKLASFVGNPLYADQQTATQEIISNYRICVELKVDSKFPNQVPYVNEFEITEIDVLNMSGYPHTAKIV